MNHKSSIRQSDDKRGKEDDRTIGLIISGRRRTKRKGAAVVLTLESIANAMDVPAQSARSSAPSSPPPQPSDARSSY